MKNPIIEAAKEILRYALFAAISAFITAVVDQLTKLPDQNIIIMALTMAFRYIDKYLFEKSKQEKGETKGLLPF